MKKQTLKRFKQNSIVMSLSSCITILRSPARVALSSFLAFSLVACNQAGTTHGPTTINQFGGDKNDPGGYEGSGGTGDGGGGQGILCSAETKNPALKSKLLVRDIFEAIHNSKLTIKELKSSSMDTMEVSDEAIDLLISSLRSYFGPAMSNLEVGDKKFWHEFIKNISFISEDASLYPSQDANSPIALPAGCKIAQIAFWDDSNGRNEAGTLYVDKHQWLKLDGVNKVALLAHEYYFKQARQAGFRNSDSVRSKIGRLFSNEGVEPLFKNWIASKYPIASETLPETSLGFKFCKGVSQDDPKAELHMYQYEGKDQEQHFVFPAIYSTNLSINSLLAQEFILKNMSKDLIAATNIMLHGGKEIESYAKSRIEPYENALKIFSSNVGILPFPSHVQGSHEDDPSMPDKLITFLRHLEENAADEVWADSIKVSSGYLKIKLINPTNEPNSKRLSAHEMMIVVQDVFIKKLKSYVPAEKWSEAQTDLISLVSQLHEEVKQGAKNKSEFTKFNKKFDEFVDKHIGNKNISADDKNQPNSEPAEEAEEEIASTAETSMVEGDVYILRDEIPQLLLKASMNLISENDVKEALIPFDQYYKRTLKSYPKAKVVLSLNETRVEYTLTCKDADALYAEKIDARSQLLKKDHAISLRNNFKVSPTKRVVKNLNSTLEAKLTTFLDYLEQGAELHTHSELLMCAGEKNINDECTLRERLSTATKMTYESCTAADNVINMWANNDGMKLCLIVNFPEDSARYLIWGEVGEYDASIISAKQISPIPTYKPE